jgi:transposase InsO family protein
MLANPKKKQAQIVPGRDKPGCATFLLLKKPMKKWLTDLTEFRIPAGKVYLSPIIDCFDGMVVSWAGTSPDADSSTHA